MNMKRSIFGLAFMATMFAGCQTEPMNETLIVGSSAFDASTEVFVPQTKTSMTQDKQVVWSQNDKIAIFQGCTVADEFLVTDSSDGKTNGTFNIVRDNSEVNGSFSAGTEVSRNVAFYPYAEDLSLSGASIDDGTSYEIEGVVLPVVQNYVAGSFGSGAFPMVAVTENMSDHTLRFKNVLGAMKLQLKGTQTVKSIKVEGKNNEKLSGAATVTAYTDETKPAITMTQSASTSVALDCGDGVQLSESTATEFIIALPPVLFGKGFTVTVTDSDSKTYTVETDKANIVLRSSLLTMPTFKLGEAPESGTPDNAVDMILFDVNELTVIPGLSYTLAVNFEPYNVADKTLVWNSSSPSVASVDASGTVTSLSEGTSTITAVAVGGATATCVVTVKSCVSATIDYEVDGINYGKGIAIGDVVWAPVNCGYHKTDYPYGKLYQWGRKYGQGYGSSDASYPSGDNLVEGPVMPSVGQAEENKDKFYYMSVSSYDWSMIRKDQLWNSGSESSPVKTVADPCPTGWRVPTYGELSALINNKSSWTTNDAGQDGYYFSGEYTFIDGAPQVFFPAAGYRSYSTGNANYRGVDGNYWPSNSYYNGNSYGLSFSSNRTYMTTNVYRAYGYSVRCVQVTD